MLRVLLLTGIIAFPVSPLFGQTSSPSAAPSLEQRVAAYLEAYVTNSPRGADIGSAGSSKIAAPGPGHNAWMMTCAALVLFMTLPGLALFYGGLVRAKERAVGAGAVSRHARAWSPSVVGRRLQLRVSRKGDPVHRRTEVSPSCKGVSSAPERDYALGLAERVLDVPADVRDHHAGADRRRDRRAHEVLGDHGVHRLWMFVVYFPLAHMVWGVDGFMNGVWNASATIKAIDFAGGTVVHMTSGWSALVLCLILGKRPRLRQGPFLPHSLVLTMVGTGMLWVGWYGFNAGSAVAPTASPPTPSRPPRSRPRSPRSRGPCSSGSRAASRPCSASARAPSPAWSSSRRLRLRRSGRRGHHRRAGGRGSVLRLHQAQVRVQLRRRARHVRRARRGRHAGRVADRHLRDGKRKSESFAKHRRLAQSSHAKWPGTNCWSRALDRAIKSNHHHDPAGSRGKRFIGALVRGVIGLRIPPEIERQGLDINQHGEEGDTLQLSF